MNTLQQIRNIEDAMLPGDGRSMVDLPPRDDLAGAIDLQFHEIKRIGADLRILAGFS